MKVIGLATENEDGLLCDTCQEVIRVNDPLFWNINYVVSDGLDDEFDDTSIVYGNNDPRIETDVQFDKDNSGAVCGKCMGLYYSPRDEHPTRHIQIHAAVQQLRNFAHSKGLTEGQQVEFVEAINLLENLFNMQLL